MANRFRQRFYLDPERERGFHWRAQLLQVAKWPHQVAALLSVVEHRKVRYTITPKRAAEPPHRLLMPAHLTVALVVALAAALGIWRHGGLAPRLWVFAGLAIGISLLLSWTETWRYPAPYDLALLNRRQRELRGSAPG